MTIEIRVYKKPDDIRAAAKEASKARLFVNRWTMGEMWKWYQTCSEQYLDRVVIAYANGVPIGAALAHCGTAMTFVRVAHRRKGIGTKMVKALLKNHPQAYRISGDSGVVGSGRFYESVGLDYTGEEAYR